MNNFDKLDMFNHELNMITEDNIRKFAETLLLNTGDWFYIEPASTSGKHHPAYALGDGGLVRHTQVLVYCLRELISAEIFGKYSEHQTNLLILAGIAHDIRKHDENGAYVKKHPKYAAEFIKRTNDDNGFVSEEDVQYIIDAVRSHMGKWDKPKPKKQFQKLLHTADYIASRRALNADFSRMYE